MFSSHAFRSLSLATAVVAASTGAQAALVIPVNFLVADCVQAFSTESIDALAVTGVSVTALGNASLVANSEASYAMPITTITISSSLKIAKGDAKGSALQFTRVYRGNTLSLTLANFTLNYDTKKVLADVTPSGGTTTKQQVIYNFHTATPLGIKYQFPLKITGHEVLDQLFLSPESVESFMTGLSLAKAARSVLGGVDFGTLTQDIAVKLRAKPVSTTLYVPAP